MISDADQNNQDFAIFKKFVCWKMEFHFGM